MFSSRRFKDRRSALRPRPLAGVGSSTYIRFDLDLTKCIDKYHTRVSARQGHDMNAMISSLPVPFTPRPARPPRPGRTTRRASPFTPVFYHRKNTVHQQKLDVVLNRQIPTWAVPGVNHIRRYPHIRRYLYIRRSK